MALLVQEVIDNIAEVFKYFNYFNEQIFNKFYYKIKCNCSDKEEI